MTDRACLTALATIGLLLGAAGTATADPYADEAISLERGGSADGTYNTDADGVDLNNDRIADIKDRGNEALGEPNWYGSNVWNRATVLGFDPVTGQGGNIVLGFTDNICLDGPGADIRLYDVWGNQSRAGDESAEVEISSDGGDSYVLLADQARPGRYAVDVNGDLPYFNQVRVTATSTDSWPTLSGMDLDAVECLYPVEAPRFDYNLDRCDRQDGVADGDIKSVVAYSQDGVTRVVVEVCGAVSPDSEYKIMVDTLDPADLDGDGDLTEPDTLLAGDTCRPGADAVVAYRGGQTGGPGLLTDQVTHLELEVANADLPGGLDATRLVVWTEVREQNFQEGAATVSSATGPSDSLSAKAYRKVSHEFRKWVKETEKRARRIARWDPELGAAIREFLSDFRNGGGGEDDTGTMVLAGDNAPNTEPGDGCATPQLRSEVLELELQ